MILSDNDIEEYLNKNEIVILPRPSNNRINGASVDLKLGNRFKIFQDYTASFIDLSVSVDNLIKLMDKIVSKEIKLSKDEIFFLHPGELVLAITLESIKLSDNIIGWINGHSLLARLGLMIYVTSHRIDPGWNGKIVLEFFNLGKLPLALRPGMSIASLSFQLLSNNAHRPYNKRKDAKYINQTKIRIVNKKK